jgi:hypothetical protein
MPAETLELSAWHAFRRGLGARLNDLGVDGKTIQSILRHTGFLHSDEAKKKPRPV